MRMTGEQAHPQVWEVCQPLYGHGDRAHALLNLQLRQSLLRLHTAFDVSHRALPLQSFQCVPYLLHSNRTQDVMSCGAGRSGACTA